MRSTVLLAVLFFICFILFPSCPGYLRRHQASGRAQKKNAMFLQCVAPSLSQPHMPSLSASGCVLAAAPFVGAKQRRPIGVILHASGDIFTYTIYLGYYCVCGGTCRLHPHFV